jgi:hypothetical protein
MTIKSDGNVGIGTTSPQRQLSLFSNNTETTPRLLIEQDGSGDAVMAFSLTGGQGWSMGIDNSGGDSFMIHDSDGGVDSSSQFTIKTNGNVGIGTTAPGVKLDVFGADGIRTTVNSGSLADGYFAQLRSDFGTNPLRLVSRSGDVFRATNFGQDVSILTGGTGSGTSERMRINSSGNVGIGTTSPAALLHLSSTSPSIYIEDTDATNTYNITRISNSGGNLNFDTRRSSDGAFVSTDYQIVKNAAGANYHRWLTANTERMRINATGDILFGTTSETNSHAYFSAESNSRMVLSLGAATASASTIASFKNSNGAVGSISVGGSATAFNTSSDYRLKEDLKDFDGLDKVSKIPVYDFKWKVDDSRSYGVMAHELQEVLPSAVKGEKDGEKMQGVDYSKIVPLLIKSIQELKAEVEDLKSKI